MRGAVRDHFVECGLSVRISKNKLMRAIQLRYESMKAETLAGRPCDVLSVYELMSSRANIRGKSKGKYAIPPLAVLLDVQRHLRWRRLYTDDRVVAMISLGNRFPQQDPVERAARLESLEHIHKCILQLSRRDRKLLNFYFGLDGKALRPMSSLARQLGISRQLVHVYLQSAILRLWHLAVLPSATAPLVPDNIVNIPIRREHCLILRALSLASADLGFDDIDAKTGLAANVRKQAIGSLEQMGIVTRTTNKNPSKYCIRPELREAAQVLVARVVPRGPNRDPTYIEAEP